MLNAPYRPAGSAPLVVAVRGYTLSMRTPRPCPICPHPLRPAIERDLSDLIPAWRVAKRRHVSRYYLVRHLKACELLPETQAAYQRVLEASLRMAEVLAAEWYGRAPSATAR
jgi:hypothetical protein